MVNAPPKQPTPPKLSKLEGIKERSHHLRHPLVAELQTDAKNLPEEAIQILKFHGSYQQDNRDNRVKGQEKDYQFMLRTRSPGGFIPAELYKTLDELSETYGNHTLRTTTRQGFQIHGVLKQNLKTVIAAIIRSMGSTLGACGDLNRNVMAPPAPYTNRPAYTYAQDYANRIADLLTPQTGAYYEIWLDGEKFLSAEEHPEVKAARQQNTNGTNLKDDEEPIYGEHYMPRKFKVAVTVPGDNSIDLYTQDVGLVVILDDQDQLQGFNVFVGGGMGRTHKKEETFARIADPLGYVAKEEIYDLVKAIVATQRDYGDRQQRRHARMKYLIHDWGIDKFRSVVEQYFGKSLAPSRPLPDFRYEDYLGWHEQGDGQLFLGISIENGRVFDSGKLQLKSALRQITQQFTLPMRLTANHNLILYNIQPSDKGAIQDILNHAGVLAETEIDPLVRYAMACPALPTCGLAIAESERAIPGILDRIRGLLNRLELSDQHFVIRMTGCPNGCARPYMAELGFVGIKPTAYQLWLGGSPNQTRLARTFMEVMPIDELETTLEPLLAFFKQKGKSAESFGDFCDRMGFDALRQFSDTYDPATQTGKIASGKARVRHRVNLREDVYSRLKETASAQGKTLTEVASDAIDTYLKNQSQA
ncbi:sulfite reductase, ferredoxin dependent [Acaryochloris sp. IP29b_bin.137]|uniref:sulfite reductase, ferredoxin dependent n=1 Tax=Acaryochloris sp. IP29b_bin.137 TaxID=2969217 RepID=UPI00262AA305|nr:sulfite reductase, ferredoxin dependent [Acaryochloris sp. IP29b_bin.137]